ncbi:MAG: nucleoside hydrolase [Bacteroidota bacterium]
MPHKLIIDTDPGVDDALAIQFTLNSPELELLGLTTIFGNVDVDLATTNALRLLDLGGCSDIPVAKGTAKPLVDSFLGGAQFVHGDDGQGNTFRPESKNKAIELSAADFIIEQVKKYPHEVVLAAVGPYTNLALALQKAPEIQQLVKEVVVMGGNAFQEGNITPAAEANVYGDVHAADMVLGANWPITMIGLDVTHTIMLHENRLAAIAKQSDAPLHNFVADAYIFYQDFYKKANKIAGSYIHDSSVIAYLVNKDLFESMQCPIRVETSDCISKGKTWPSLGTSDNEESEALKPWKNRPKVNLCTKVDSEAVLKLLEERLY